MAAANTARTTSGPAIRERPDAISKQPM